MALKRKKFQGVLNILSFNRHFYIIGLIALTLLMIVFKLLNLPFYFHWITLIAFLYGLLMPLIVSAYVYDFSGFYNFEWLKNLSLSDTPDTLNLNINAGFDETSFIIKDILPKSDLKVFDFYNSEKHTEAAIVRARKVTMLYPNTKEISTDYIPLYDQTVNHIFLLSAVHEIRSQKEKIVFLKECHRVCKNNGSVVLVEHLRDWPNFIAFTIGFTHFFSKNTWMVALKKSGFNSIKEIKFTPFMSIFICNP